MVLENLNVNPEILGGKPCIRGTRISVELLLEWLSSGASAQEIVKTYPEISEAAISDCLKYAAGFLKNESIHEIPLTA